MARINIEDDIERREEFWRLFEIVKDRDIALGKLVRFFRLAQTRFAAGHGVAYEELEKHGLTCMVPSGWAVPNTNGPDCSTYMAIGADKQFAWLEGKRAAGRRGGLASGEARRKHAPSETKQVLHSAEAKPSKTNPLTLSPSLTLTQKQENYSVGEAAAPLRPKGTRGSGEGKLVAQVIGAYVKAWQERHDTTEARPDLGGKARGIVARLVRDHPIEKLVELVQVYCQMRVPWFETKGYDLATFEQNISKVELARAKGTESGIDWGKVFGDGSGKLSGANAAVSGDVRRAELSAGAGGNHLESLPACD